MLHSGMGLPSGEVPLCVPVVGRELANDAQELEGAVTSIYVSER